MNPMEEVECKRKDGSWHPCQISLSEGNAAIIVAYENSEEEEVEKEEVERIGSRDEGLARLRFRSAFLQGGECSRLVQGQRVLALHGASSSNLFFDAVVEKINRVRHSDRLACRCTFSLKWIPNYLPDPKVRVTSACIMRLSDKNIETHPVFEAFVEATNSSAENRTPAFVSPFSENLFGVDLDDLLDNQMQNINMDQGADCSKNGLVGHKKVKGPGPKRDRRVTSNKSKQEMEPSLEEAIKKATSHSFLSPLAARAALASVICTLPVSALSKQLEELPVSPQASKLDFGFPLFSPIAAHTNLTSFASVLPENEPPKQAKKRPSTLNQSYYNSDNGRRVGVNPGSEKIDPVIPRRTTRSATKKEGVDLKTDMQGAQNERSRETEKGKRKLGYSNSAPDVEAIVTPVMSENKKIICISPIASAATSASIVTDAISDCEANGLPKQAKKPPLTSNKSGCNLDAGRTFGVNPGSRKVGPLIPRRVTRSATKWEGVDMTTDMQTHNEKSLGTETSSSRSGKRRTTPDVEAFVTPVYSENKKKICISPIASAATSASIVTNSISDCEGETYQDAESQTVAKRTKTAFRKPPTRFSARLAQLDNDISQPTI